MSAPNDSKMNQILALCRPGFENDCANELMFHANKAQLNAYVKAKTNNGYIQLIITDSTGIDAISFLKSINFYQCIFVRQWFASNSEVILLNEQDRTSMITQSIKELKSTFNDIELSYADTNTGKSLSKFCKQFLPHLQRALKTFQQPSNDKLNIFFLDSTHVFIGVNQTNNSALASMGIPRLRMPSSAPSRSTLKLEEAINTFLTADQQKALIKPGMKAVDLGAAPGGWTWQLVQRQLFVTAIDNGPMDKTLMQTEMVEHLKTDAFTYSLKKVAWLVCDMVEQPHRVAKLISQWFTKRWCQHAIFNLKLPMNKRYDAVKQCEKTLLTALDSTGQEYTLQIKQLYHDREEVTVCILTNAS